MRKALLLALISVAAPAEARRPVSLLPFESEISFSPDQPRVIGADHPLFRRISVENVQNMPGRIGSFLVAVTDPGEFNAALRSTLSSANLLAQTEGDARARLRVTWRQFDMPFHIGMSSRASVAINYELSRIDNGQVIFSREILTGAEFRGGNAATRAQGTGRAAVLANIASVTLCLEKAAYGQAPADCAVHAVGRFSAPIAVAVPLYRPVRD
jgi:hypothetical protein